MDNRNARIAALRRSHVAEEKHLTWVSSSHMANELDRAQAEFDLRKGCDKVAKAEAELRDLDSLPWTLT